MQKLTTHVRSMAIGRPIAADTQAAVETTAGKTKALPEDAFDSMYRAGSALVPWVEPSVLTGLPHFSDTLKPAIQAMAQNIDGFGHQFVARRAPKSPEETAAAEAERVMLQHFFDYANPHMSFVRLRKCRREDMETCGRGAFEVPRSLPTDDAPAGRITGFNHIRSKNIRFCPEDREPTLAQAWRFNDETGQWEQFNYYWRFRRYIHVVNGMTRYFREFGDPRQMDMNTGAYFVDSNKSYITDARKLTPEQHAVAANELWVETIYDPDDVQGNPRWLGAMIDVENSRLAAESAHDYLQQGGIPICMMAVQGGALDSATFDRVNSALDDARGSHPENRMIVVEVVPTKIEGGPMDGPSAIQPKIEVTKLNDLQRSDDSMFLGLRKDGADNVLKPFRVNSLFLGKNNDQSFATANVSMQLNESQVFAPERDELDWWINSKILPELGAIWWTFKSKGPKLEDNATWKDALRMAIEWGAVPDYPTLRAILSEVLGYDLPTGGPDKEPAEWEKMPPAFVRILLQVVQGFPQFADLEDALGGISEPPAVGVITDEAGPQTVAEVDINRSSQQPPRRLVTHDRNRFIDRAAARVVEIMMAARKKLARDAAAEEA